MTDVHRLNDRLAGKVAMVTGAASGIGRATVERLVSEGAKVVLTDRLVEPGERAADETGTTFLPLDVTQEKAWREVVDQVVARFGRLDVLVNNAGVGVVKSVEATSLEEWRFVHAVNAEGPFLGCREAIRVMKMNEGPKGGSIVNISSIAGLVGDASLAAYCASKGSVRLLTKSVALHCAQRGYGIRCNSVHPSFIATPMVEDMVNGATDSVKVRGQLERSSPLGRFGQPAEVAAMIAFLASDDAAFVTGAELVIDGGATAR